MKRSTLFAGAILAAGGLLGWLAASGRLLDTFAQDKKAEPRVPDAPALVVDGSVLPFPPTPSASTAGLTMQDSIYKKRVDPKRLAEGAPNILVILMDDVGPGTPSTYGGEINTPTLSRVAKKGVSYNRFHSTAMCSPTRASLLTGRNHTRVGNGQITALANDFDGFSGTIPKSSATVAEVLKCYGYNTGAWGKWHNTPEEHITSKGPFEFWPTGYGFEYFYGFLAGEASQYEPAMVRNTTPVNPHEIERKGYHLTEDIAEDAVKWLREQQAYAPDKPFMMYWAPGAAHGPHQIMKEWADKYKGKFDDGWDKYRERAFARQKELGWIPKESMQAVCVRVGVVARTGGRLAMNNTIIAVDLGRHKSVACVYDRGTRAHAFRELDTTPGALDCLLASYPGAAVVIEACANAGWVHDRAVAAGHPVKVANTAAEAWKFKHLKRKTDRDDALRLAQLEALGQLPTVAMPDPATRQRRMLIACRQELVGRRVACQNRIRALFAAAGLATPSGHRAWTEAGLLAIGSHAKPLAECAPEELWRGVLQLALAEYAALVGQIAEVERALDALAKADPATVLLETIPGLGRRTAEAVAAHVGDATRFASAKQVGAYAGLVPRQYQSGVTDRKGRITRRGPALLRKLLVECAWCMLRYNGWARAVYARLTGGGQARKKPAIVALARKVLVRCWAMLRDGVPWRDEPDPASGRRAE